MKAAAPILCDLCGQTIAPQTPWTQIRIVIPDDVRQEIQESWSASRTDAPRTGFLQLLEPQVPTHWMLDVCRACEDARWPDLRPRVAVLALTLLEEQRARAARPAWRRDDPYA